MDNPKFRVVIPAGNSPDAQKRHNPLFDIAGQSVLQYTYERAIASGAMSVVVATDCHDVAKACDRFGAKVCMTSAEHHSGTQRLGEVVVALDYQDDEIIVNVPCDEPMIRPESILQVAQDLVVHDHCKVSTICYPIDNIESLFCPDHVKVAFNKRGFALYFSRSPIPWEKNNFAKEPKVMTSGLHHRHFGIYGYRAGFLSEYLSWDHCSMTAQESLEQLKVLWYGGRIHVTVVHDRFPLSVDSPEELQIIIQQLAKDNKQEKLRA